MGMEFLFVQGPGSPDDFLFLPTLFVYPSQTPSLPAVSDVDPPLKEATERPVDGSWPPNVASGVVTSIPTHEDHCG